MTVITVYCTVHSWVETGRIGAQMRVGWEWAVCGTCARVLRVYGTRACEL